jgi:hypothetical protein|tara:strand:+ start:194 stop:604 length:411 start_codon:yes stop_codon:yes gene_type:complete
VIFKTDQPTANQWDINTADWAPLVTQAGSPRFWAPTSQKNDVSLMAVHNLLIYIWAFDEGGVMGYAVLIHDTNTLAQIAFRKGCKHLRLGSILMAQLQALTRGNGLKAINADESDDGSAIFMVHLNAGQRVLRLTR